MTTSCLAQNTTSRKRKRLHVSFCTLPENVIYTHSQSDYDRGSSTDFFSDYHTPAYFFALKINFIPQEQPIESTSVTSDSSNNKKRPKLTIDTSNLSGPLYFTKMTTNHQKRREAAYDDDNDFFDRLTAENTRRNSLPFSI